MMETLEPIQDEDKIRAIDEFIIDNAGQFDRFHRHFNKMVGQWTAEKTYLEGDLSGQHKTWTVEKYGLRFILTCEMHLDEPERGLNCTIKVVEGSEGMKIPTPNPLI